MSLEAVLIWLGIGLVAGWLASAVVGGGYGVIGDIVVGIVGSFLGGVIFRGLHISSPLGGVPGMILVALVGAIALLVLIRIIRAATARRNP